MKIIEGMKKIKDLTQKCDDLKKKVHQYQCDIDYETPVYGTEDKQKAQIVEWLQSHSDSVKEIGRLRASIQRTNVLTKLKIQLGDNIVEKSLAEWVYRKRDLAKMELSMWGQLDDRGLGERGNYRTSTGETKECKIRRYYDPKQRDTMKAIYSSEPFTIDGSLEVANAVTDLIEE